MKQLIRAGAGCQVDLKMTNERVDLSPLSLAARQCNYNVVKALLKEARADPKIKSSLTGLDRYGRSSAKPVQVGRIYLAAALSYM